MTTLHSFLVTSHIAVGSLALLLFWMPAIARKGSPLHVRSGRIYVIAMYIVSVTAFVASVMVLVAPLEVRRPGEVFDAADAASLAARYRMTSLFLLMLSVLVFTSLRHGIAALRERRLPGTLKEVSHRATVAALAVLAPVVGVIGLMNSRLLLIIFAGIGLSAAFGMWRDTRIDNPGRRDLVVAHFNGLIGSGIGAYTAFFAFGGARYLGDVLQGQWQVVPWVLPAIVGTIVINRLQRSFNRPLNRGAEVPRAGKA